LRVSGDPGDGHPLASESICESIGADHPRSVRERLGSNRGALDVCATSLPSCAAAENGFDFHVGCDDDPVGSEQNGGGALLRAPLREPSRGVVVCTSAAPAEARVLYLTSPVGDAKCGHPATLPIPREAPGRGFVPQQQPLDIFLRAAMKKKPKKKRAGLG